MKKTTLFGILGGTFVIYGAFFFEGGNVEKLFLWPAMLIVFGGTLAAGFAGTTASRIANLPKLIKIAVSPPKFDIEYIILQIVEFSAIARRQGILALEPKLNQIKHPFLKKLFQTAIDGADPDTIQRIAENEINYITERHNSNIGLFTKLGGFSPTMGIIGTVIGLILTLAKAGSEPNVLIHNISTAFIATLWGIFMANIVWLPIGDKLRTLHNDEMQLLQVMVDGVYSVQLGEIPSVIRANLVGVFPLVEQERILEEHRKIHSKILGIAPKPPEAERQEILTQVPIPESN